MTPGTWLLLVFIGNPTVAIIDGGFADRAECLAAAPAAITELQINAVDGYTCMTAGELFDILREEGA